MNSNSWRSPAAGGDRRRGTTFTEVLVVIATLLVLIAIVYPVLSTARKAADVQRCILNLREIGTASHFYMKDNDPTNRGSLPTQPWYLDDRCDFSYGGVRFTYASEFVYGGFRHTTENPMYPDSDTYVIPTELRPYNKYIAPGLAGRSPIKNWICPADDSSAVPILGVGIVPTTNSTPSWEVNGNSYAINWFWGSGTPMQSWYLPCMSLYGTATLTAKTGAAASEFVLFMEGMMNSYLLDAVPPDGSHGESTFPLGMGWHGKRSTYTMGFYDGHAEYRFIDTRYTKGTGYNLYPEPTTQWPKGCPDYDKEAAK